MKLMRAVSRWSKTGPRYEARNTDSSQLWKVMKEWRWKREIKATCKTFFFWEPTAPSALRLPAQHAPVSAATHSNTTASATHCQSEGECKSAPELIIMKKSYWCHVCVSELSSLRVEHQPSHKFRLIWDEDEHKRVKEMLGYKEDKWNSTTGSFPSAWKLTVTRTLQTHASSSISLLQHILLCALQQFREKCVLLHYGYMLT